LYEYFVKFITLETKDVTIFSKKWESKSLKSKAIRC
jgi:hypothetical protein